MRTPTPGLDSWKLNLIFGTLFLLLCGTAHAQQADSLYLPYKELSWKDVKGNEELSVGTKVISGSRSERDAADLPFTIYVITAEQIRRNGFVTLVDALKRVPGIRVSQPGSALEGETFLMRGLLGNGYAKILINDVPIKPFVVNGMPIGAQLPIRQAERIEIIFGPAATLYGADASAGVINIILKESDRPLTVQTDLGFGSPGYENLDIMIGGKTGKDDKVLKFRLFGNFTSFQDRRVKYDRNRLYNPETYQQLFNTDDIPYEDLPNYQGDSAAPILNEYPHQSSALGIELEYRKWHLAIHRYQRRDHSAIGLSPYAVSHANSENFFGEDINSFQLRHRKTGKRGWRQARLASLLYQTDDRSSQTYVVPTLSVGLKDFYTGTPEFDSASQVIDDRFFSGQRYSTAQSLEINTEFLGGYTINDYLEVQGGLNLQGGGGQPLLNFSPVSREIQDTSITPHPLGEIIVFYVEASSYAEFYLNTRKWNAILGGQAFWRQTDFSVTQRVFFNPRLAVQHHVTDWLSFRASAGSSFKYPSPFYSTNTYRIPVLDPLNVSVGQDLDQERTRSLEVGTRWRWNSNVSLDLSAFTSSTTNFITYGVRLDSSAIFLGYNNDSQSYADLDGIQASLIVRDIVPSLALHSTLHVAHSNGEEALTIFNIDGVNAGLPELLVLDRLRAQPNWIIQWDMEARPWKKLRVLLEHTYVSSSWTRNTLVFQTGLADNTNQEINPGYYTLDMTFNYDFSERFLALFKFHNFFGNRYAGIDATADFNGLTYNPQSRFFFRIGASYRLE